MKKSILFLSVMIVSVCAFAQSEKYTAAMKANIAAIDTSFKNPQNLLGLANNFERIALAEKDQWLPYYYAAFCQVNYTYMEQDKSKVDAIADKATWLINKADSLQPANSENSCVKSMIAIVRLLVNPMQRYMQYGTVSSNFLKDAMEQDPANPRPYMLKGQTLLNTPEQYGGGCKIAKPVLEEAMAKFEAFKPASDISPNWGKSHTETQLKTCP